MVDGAENTIFLHILLPFFILLRLFQSVCRTLGLFCARFFARSENQGIMLVVGLMSLSHQEAQSPGLTHNRTFPLRSFHFATTSTINSALLAGHLPFRVAMLSIVSIVFITFTIL